jgi:polyisoprenyl-phosphate glycosyltransferase
LQSPKLLHYNTHISLLRKASMPDHKVSCILPSYNERDRIGAVLEVLTNSSLINELIVVNNGTDDSDLVIEPYKNKITHYLNFDHKLGKGGALREALKYVSHPTTFLIDADLVGLEERHIGALVLPVIRDETDMSVGILYRWGDHAHFFRHKMLTISGQRAIKTKLLKKALAHPLAGEYGPEVCMNYYFYLHGLRRQKVTLFGPRDTPNFVKHGLWVGGQMFVGETVDVLRKYGELYLWRFPQEKIGIVLRDMNPKKYH